MIDITSFNETTNDLNMVDTQAPKAGNILSVQVGALEYAQDLGIDLAYFMDEKFRYQNESFISYIIEVLANRGVNVAEITQVINNLSRDLIINVSPDETSTALVAG
jgi:hypothetical protein